MGSRETMKNVMVCSSLLLLYARMLLGVWTHAPLPSLPQIILSSRGFETLSFSGNTVATGSSRTNNHKCSIRVSRSFATRHQPKSGGVVSITFTAYIYHH